MSSRTPALSRSLLRIGHHLNSTSAVRMRQVLVTSPGSAAAASSLSHRWFGITAFESGGGGGETHYVSPMQDFWDAVESNQTTLGLPSSSTATRSKLLKCGVDEASLRFTTTSYGRTMNAPHVHPKEHQVVLKINTNKLPVQGIEKEILREIVGRRLNDERGELRLTSDHFGSRIENKRHLVSMLDRIILSCQRLGKELQNEEHPQDSSAAA